VHAAAAAACAAGARLCSGPLAAAADLTAGGPSGLYTDASLTCMYCCGLGLLQLWRAAARARLLWSHLWSFCFFFKSCGQLAKAAAAGPAVVPDPAAAACAAGPALPLDA
jgi:hypothetical protein